MNRGEILNLRADSFPVETRAWGTVKVRELCGDDLAAVMEILEQPAGAGRLAALVILGCVDPQFHANDAAALMRGPVEPLNVIGDAVLERAGLGVGKEKKSSAPKNTPPISSPMSLGSPIRKP